MGKAAKTLTKVIGSTQFDWLYGAGVIVTLVLNRSGTTMYVASDGHERIFIIQMSFIIDTVAEPDTARHEYRR